MSEKIRYAVAKFDAKDGSAIESTMQWMEAPAEIAIKEIKEKGSEYCATFFYQDIAKIVGNGRFPEEMNATKELFESDPFLYGILLYKQPFEGGKWVFE